MADACLDNVDWAPAAPCRERIMRLDFCTSDLPPCRAELQAFGIKMVMTAASVYVTGVTWLSIVYLVGFFFICYLYLRWLPHMHAWVNHVRVATAFCLLYAALLLIILAFHPGVAGDDDEGLTSFR